MGRNRTNRCRLGIWLTAAVFFALLVASVMIVPPPWVTASEDQDLQPQAGRGEGPGFTSTTSVTTTSATTTTQPVRADWTNSIGMKFVLIPAGSFMMGSDSGGRDEQPVHQVQITNPFYLGIFEVTQAEWMAVMGSNPSYFSGDDSRPVEQVSWYDVQEFIFQLNALEETDKYRLPTEAEWEYACRAGSTTAFCFGDDESQLTQYGWYMDNAGLEPHSVGHKLPNAWGLYDMHGNVWEWCADRYGSDYYTHSPASDPQGPSSGESCVLRGATWQYYAWYCRSAYRWWFFPRYKNKSFGFRIARITP